MIYACVIRPCSCASPKGREANECWCWGDDEHVCVRCNETLAKQSPGVVVRSGLHEGDRIEEPKK